MTPNGTTGAAPDPNVIPTIALERIEVVADGASAIYGSDAITGVANLILRRKVDQPEITAHFGVGDEYKDRNIGALWGTDWDGGNIMLSFENAWHSNLSGVDRDYFASDLRPQGGADSRVTQCDPGNVVIGTTTYPIPASGPVTPATLVAGPANRCDNIKYIDLLPEMRRNSVAMTFDHVINDRFSLFAEGYWSRREYEFLVPTPAQNVTVRNTNAFYVRPGAAPAGTTETVAYSFANDYGPVNPIFGNTGYAETYNLIGGLTVALPADWRAQASFGFGHGREQNYSLSIDATALTAALNSSNPATALNVFGTSGNTAAVLASLPTRVSIAPGRSIQRTYNLALDGPVFSLPGGQVRAALGAEARYLSLLGGQSIGPLSGPITTSVFSDRDVTSVFAEVAVPLVGDANSVTGFRRVDLSMAVRREDYSDFGSTTHPKFGIDWTLIDGLKLHASYGTSFRAPGLSQLRSIAAPGIFVQNYSDPLANGGAGGITQGAAINGGNPNLGPERAKTWSYGLDWSPVQLPGLAVSINYFDLEYTDQIIGYLANLSILQNPVAYSAVFQRRPSDPAGSAAFTALLQRYISEGRALNPGGTTPAQVLALNLFVDGRGNNQAVTIAKGLDFDVRYKLDTEALGTFQFGFAGTRFLKYLTAATATAPQLDVLNSISFPLQFRARGFVGWRNGSGWNGRVVVNRAGGYRNDLANPVQRVNAYTTLDARLGYDFDASGVAGFKGLSIAFEATNLFDQDPPFVNIAPNVNGGGGFDPNAASPIGRLLGVTVSKRF
jgi:iron complex outermembrane receptor protein